MAATVPAVAAPFDDPLSRAASGDGDAFADLIRAHQDMVFSIAWHFFHDRDRAEEIAQDVFLQLYRALGQITSNAHLVFWLRKVTASRCIDETRRARVHLVALEDVPELQWHAERPDPLLATRLRSLVNRLPPAQRLVITLRYQEELEPQEIGTVVGMPLNTVKSHLRRGLSALRSWLGPQGEPGEPS